MLKTREFKGFALKWYRELRFLNAKEVAEKAGISRAYLSLLESEKKLMSDRLERRIFNAINSLVKTTRARTIEFTVKRINEKVFHAPDTGEYRWKGSWSPTVVTFVTTDIKVEIRHDPTEPEVLASRKDDRVLLSGSIQVDTPDGTKKRFFLLREDMLEVSLKDFGLAADSRVDTLLTEFTRMVRLFWEVSPGTLARQMDEILKTKSK